MHPLVILMKWALKNGEWDVVLRLYTFSNIGVPNTSLYSDFQQKSEFSLNEALVAGDNTVLSSQDASCRQLLSLFPRSRYGKLEEWDGRFGYRRR
jgi:hypothetical protein